MWRAIEDEDLIATLSAKEVDAFKQSVGSETDDPVGTLIARVTALVRSYIRASHTSLSTDGDELPEALISPACAIAAYDILKRLPVEVGQDRRRAYEDAMEILEKVASGDLRVEPEDEDDEASLAKPHFSEAFPHHKLDPLW